MPADAAGGRGRIAACISSSREFTPGILMPVAIGLPAVAQPLDAAPPAPRSLVIDGAAVAERAEVLGRIEAERAGDADGADRPPVGGRQMCLAAVLDDRQRVRARRSRSIAAMSAG